MASSQTIFALSSGSLPSAISVVRISGPSTKKVLSLLIDKIPEPRYMTYSEIKSPKTKEIIDIQVTFIGLKPDPKDRYLHLTYSSLAQHKSEKLETEIKLMWD